jgi:CheY-like chemotaxis protein
MTGQIFVVDDNTANLNLLNGILQQAGHQVRMMNNARRALAAVRSMPPDLILLDITMPEMDGYQVCATLKAEPATANIPIIFISAISDVHDKVRAFQQGGVDYICKPFQAEEVLARVDCQLRLVRMRRDLEQQKEELIQKNRELQQSWQQTNRLFSALSEVLPGSVLDGKYRIEALIGSGGFGSVYRATQLSLDRAVAVKLIRPGRSASDADLDRFRREGLVACRLSHQNAISVLDFAIAPAGIPYLVMELLDGWPLTAELQSGVALSLPRCVQVMRPVCEVLASAHAVHVIHRDIKPDNIFLHHQGGEEIVKVVDFGIARLRDDAMPQRGRLTLPGQLLGTPHYMSPERLLCQPHDERADSYSVGIVLYQMLSGHLPYLDGHSGGVEQLTLLSTLQQPVPLDKQNPAVPPELAALIMRTLSRDPRQRPAMVELAQALAALGLDSELRSAAGPPSWAPGQAAANAGSGDVQLATTQGAEAPPT